MQVLKDENGKKATIDGTYDGTDAAKGRAEGIEKGLAEGIEQGIEKGAEQERKKFEAEKLKIAEYLRSNGVPENIISGGFALK